MAMPDTRHAWTAREVRQLIADSPTPVPRYELVAGELLVTPSPGPLHQEAVGVLFMALRQFCSAESGLHALPSPSDVELEPEDVRQPDLFVMPEAEWRRVRRDGFPVHVGPRDRGHLTGVGETRPGHQAIRIPAPRPGILDRGRGRRTGGALACGRCPSGDPD